MACPNYRRTRTISKAFRVTPAESDRIALLARCAGMTQQEYIMKRLEDDEFTVVPDMRTYKALRDEMRAVYRELSRLRDCSDMNERLIAKVELLSDLFAGLAGDEPESEIDKEDDMIAGMERE
jgi:hypothetical protein